MMITLENAGMYIGIITFFFVAYKYIILDPQEAKFESLREIMKTSFDSLKDVFDDLKKTLVRIDFEAKSRSDRLLICEQKLCNLIEWKDSHERDSKNEHNPN